MQDNYTANRIKSVLDYKKIDRKALAKQIDQSESTMYNYLDGTTSPRADFLQIVIEITGCNGHWLLTGQGDMFFSRENSANESNPIYNISSKSPLIGKQIIDINECKDRLASAFLEIGYLKQQVADKDLIIELFKQQQT